MSVADDILKDLTDRIARTIESFKGDLQAIRTGRANLHVLDAVRIDYYGQMTPLAQVGTLAVADARLITVKPWEKNLIPQIEKAIRDANLGLNPQSDKDIVRIPIPPLTEERRREIVKQVKHKGEEFKVAHRTQSTVSQQIKRLEDDLGQQLLNRDGKNVTPTEAGERLLSYARRLLSLAEEARDVVARPHQDGAVRLGIPEDFAAYRLTRLLARFSRARPGLRLDVRADQSLNLTRDIERGDLDLALLKREAGGKSAIAVWPERVHWVNSRNHPCNAKADWCR